MAEKNITVYMVEDYPLTRTAYKKYFEYVKNIDLIGIFESAEECIEQMEVRQADVIIMDIGLPWMNGLEATRIIKGKYPKTKILVLTSHERYTEVHAALASGAAAYALKDITLEEVVNVIKSIYKGAGWFDPKILDIVLDIFPKPVSMDLDNLYIDKTKSSGLTDKEIKVLKLISEGKSNIEIGKALGISPNTAKSHVAKVFEKLEVDDRVQAAVKAVKNDLF